MPEVMNVFSPLTTYSSFLFADAFVLKLATSEPPLGSVMASALIFSPERIEGSTRRFSSSLPDRGDRRRADGVRKQARGQAAGACARELLGAGDAEEVVRRRAAVLLGEADAEQPRGRGLPVELARELARFVPGRRVRQDLALDEAPHRVAVGLVLLGDRRMPYHAGANSTSRLPGETCVPAFT